MEMARACARVYVCARVRENSVKKKPKIVLKKTKNAQIWHISGRVRSRYQNDLDGLESSLMTSQSVKGFNINPC